MSFMRYGAISWRCCSVSGQVRGMGKGCQGSCYALLSAVAGTPVPPGRPGWSTGWSLHQNVPVDTDPGTTASTTADMSSWCHEMETPSALLALCEGNPQKSPTPRASNMEVDAFILFGWINCCKGSSYGDLRRILLMWHYFKVRI